MGILTGILLGVLGMALVVCIFSAGILIGVLVDANLRRKREKRGN
jgi:hypothetical protein